MLNSREPNRANEDVEESTPASPESLSRTLHVGQVNILNREEGYDYRYRFLAHQILTKKLDITAVQEVTHPELLQQHLPSGYESVFFKSKADAFRTYKDAVGIIYDADSLAEKGVHFEHSATVDFSWIGGHVGVLTRFHDGNAIEGNGSIYVYSGHFIWNMVNEHKRLMQLRLLASLAKYLKQQDPGSIFIIAADMNTNDDTASYGYITGKQPGIEIPTEYQAGYYNALRMAAEAILGTPARNVGTDSTEPVYVAPETIMAYLPEAQGTFFVDAYVVAGDSGEWATTDQGNNHWGRLTASRFGITHLEMLPQRRIDYIFSYEWVYGKRGCPVSYQRFGDSDPAADFPLELSDHYGISAEILL